MLASPTRALLYYVSLNRKEGAMDLPVEVQLTNGLTFQHVQTFPDDAVQFGSEYTQFLDYLKIVLGKTGQGTKTTRSIPPLVLINPTAFYNVEHVARVGWSRAIPTETEAKIQKQELGFLAALKRNVQP
jgi:hypothetical protein